MKKWEHRNHPWKQNIARGTTDPGYWVCNLNDVFQPKLFQIGFSQKLVSSYRLNTLGPLCLWQCFLTPSLIDSASWNTLLDLDSFLSFTHFYFQCLVGVFGDITMYLLSWVVKLTFTLLRMLPSPGNNSSHPLHIPALKMQPLSMAACRLLREKASQHFSTSSPWLAPSKRAPYQLACAIKVNALARCPQSVLTSHARAWSQRVGRVGCHILTTSSVFDPIIAISKLAISLFLQFPIKVKCWSFWVAFWWRLAQCSPSRWRWRRCDQRLPRRTPQEDCFHCLTRSSVPKVRIESNMSSHDHWSSYHHSIMNHDQKTPVHQNTKAWKFSKHPGDTSDWKWSDVIRSKHASK